MSKRARSNLVKQQLYMSKMLSYQDSDHLIDIENAGSKRLVFEILIKAICDALRFVDDKQEAHSERKYHKDAFFWIESSQTTPWSFCWICSQISNNPEELMKVIRTKVFGSSEKGEIRKLYEMLSRRSMSPNRNEE